MHSNPAPHIGQVHPGNQPAQERAECTGHEERPFFGGMPVQAKLEVSPPDDPHEREADAVADVVMRSADPSAPPEMPGGGAGDFVQREYSGAPAMAVQRSCATCDAEDMVQRSAYGGGSLDVVQRKCAACEAEEEKPVQRKCASCEQEDMVQRSAYSGGSGDAIQRKCAACGLDDQPVQRKCDACEKEEMVQRSPYSSVTGGNLIQRECDECKIGEASKEETEEDTSTEEPENDEAAGITPGKDVADETVSPKAAPGGAWSVGAGFESGLRSTKGGGQPLPQDVRSGMEQRFAQDFSHVRVHQGTNASSLAASINAQAFTHGSDIYFNQNKFDGRSSSGKRLLAHELTHVVQQTGSSAIQPKIQRLGKWAHNEIQTVMRGKDGDLITEAGVPGATRTGVGLNRAGYADLYKSDGHVVSGVRAKIHGEDDVPLKVKYSYEGFQKGGVKYLEMKQRSNQIKIGPRYDTKTDTWDWKPNFPAKFQIGEIKPLFLFDFPGSKDTIGGGFDQQSHYINGFTAFVAQVHKDVGSPAPASISGSPMNLDPLIPDALNYRKFDSEYTKAGAGAVLKKDTSQRIWLYNMGHGIAVYFIIQHPYTKSNYPEAADAQLQQLDPLLKDLRKKKPTMNAALGPKRIQRQGEPKTDWKAAGKAWEDKRQVWVTGKSGKEKPKKFLKEEAKGVLKRGKVDKKLGIKSTADTTKKFKQAKDIRFWSGFRGRIFGALRFKFGQTFDKIEEFFHKIREKFRKHREKAAEHQKTEGTFDGWKKTATKVIIRLAAAIFKEMIASAFQSFVNCMNSILGVIVNKYEKGLEEKADELTKELQPQCCQIMSFKEKFDKEIEKHEATIKEFTDTVDKIREWQEILSKVEIAVRLGVQIASCGLPPGLGCLWGLVAQLGIEAGLNLLMRTDYFENDIAKPAAAALMDAIVGEKLHNFMIDTLEGTPLKPYLAEAAECKRMVKGKGGGGGVGAIGANAGKINPNDPKWVKARQEWEAEHKDEILAELNKVFEQGDKPMTAEDYKTIVEAMNKSGLKPEELKRRIENAKAGEKIDLAKALKNVKRKINYDNAKKANQGYQKAIGWDPNIFQPGATDAGSEEFANAVYDLQESLGIHADGKAGGGTTQKVYDKKGLEKDGVYEKAKAVEAFEKAERERKAQEKLDDEARKKLEEFYKLPAVKTAMEKEFPTDEALKKDLDSVDWKLVDKNGIRILERSYGALFVAKTTGGSRLGAAAKVANIEKEGQTVKVVVDLTKFLLLDTTKSVQIDDETDTNESLNVHRTLAEGSPPLLVYHIFSGEKAGDKVNMVASFAFWRFPDFDGR
ncbi:eCIS core domain-containing protein [Chitinophaga caseinilytica]|uniref:eCIS core domain-containing protein n=1 Tax=Chitinophaga caseinilytica TaxID=2267521 RepID=UPI003C2E1190